MAKEADEVKRRQDARIEIRCFSEEKAQLEEAAKAEGRALSNWLLHLGLREAGKR